MRTVLRRPDFRLLFIGLFASMVGESVLLLALGIWVKDITGSDGLAGVTILAIIAPMALAPLIGWVVDRFRRRPFLIVANVVTAAVLVPLFLVRDAGHLWLIYTVALAYGASNVAVSGALNGLIKLIVPAELLAQANGALQTVRQGLRLVGPLLGAALYSAVGGWLVGLVAIVGFLVAAGMVAALRVPESAPDRSELRWLVEVSAGVRHLVAVPALRRTIAGTAFACLLVGFLESLIFAYVDQGLHRTPPFVGVLSTAQGVGGVLGGVLAAAVVRRFGEVGAVAAGLGILALGVVGLAYPQVLLGMASFVVAGFGLPLALVGLSTLLQRATPADLMGRVMTAADALITGPQAASIAVGAALVSIVDFRLLLMVTAAGLAIGGGYLWLNRKLTDPAQAVQAASPLDGLAAPAIPTEPATSEGAVTR